MFVAGDVSGDVHASSIVRELFADFPQAKIWGIGGPAMQAQGFSAMLPFEPFNRMGFLEVVAHLPFFLSAKKKVIDEIKSKRPDCLVLVDYPGFNMPVMKAAHKLGVPIVWYIAPMVWAWKKKRAAVLGKMASHIACIFPFEVDYFTSYTSGVSFVGNPLSESVLFQRERERVWNHDRELTLALVPGSRRQEIEKVFPEMVSAFRELKKRFPLLKCRVSRCGSIPEELYRGAMEGTDAELYTGPLRELFCETDLALVTSGTATLEASLMGVPMVIAYKTSLVTYSIYKKLVKIPFIGLPNIIAGEQIVPECIQDGASGEKMAEKLQAFIQDADLYNRTIAKLKGLREVLGSRKPSVEVSKIIRDIIGPLKEN